MTATTTGNAIPHKPLGFLPFRWRFHFWAQEFVVQLWRDGRYAEVWTPDPIVAFRIARQVWRHMERLEDE